jgi:hypothetical protein
MNKKYLIITASYWDWHNAAKNGISKRMIQKYKSSKFQKNQK